MFTGTPAELRRRERLAIDYAAQVADLLNRIDALGVGVIFPHTNRIAGPGFTIRPQDGRWAVTDR
ncbi:hypothetical protein GTY67_13510 [Streptomyces sp. SID8374]|uniref:hypothetical protein n=1 Tax=Streptomyces sp. SID8374 TaxID=2690354 RepID=UPI001369FD47|nr:hypothetical protein [Streptomyces sp. SID8374]MYX14414.1 hypothetical protein [Streptomyces sp. SID8374]